LCIEILHDKTPQPIWNRVNEILATIDTLNDFVECVVSPKEITFFQIFLDYSCQVRCFSFQTTTEIVNNCFDDRDWKQIFHF